MATPRRPVLLGAVALLLATAVSGHGAGAAAVASSLTPVDAAGTAVERAGQQPAPSRSATRSGLRSRLLAAADLPGATRGAGWQTAATSTREPAGLVGACHRFAMTSIGALEVAYRSYRGADGVTAQHLVAQFPDAKTAWRAAQVLTAWHDGCGESRDDLAGLQVTELREVEDARGRCHWFGLEYRDAGGAGTGTTRDAHGVALVGARLAVLRITAPGPDPEPGREPMVGAVRAAAIRLV